jgi:predicted DNA-binding transcriptional regulator AlpA
LYTANVEQLAAALARHLAARLPDPERLLDRPQLAERLGVSERTVGALVARKELPEPLLHTGGIARWSWPEVERYLAARRERTLRRGRGRYSRHAAASTGGKTES